MVVTLRLIDLAEATIKNLSLQLSSRTKNEHMKIVLFVICFICCAVASLAIKMESFKLKWYWADNKLIGSFYIMASFFFFIVLVREIKAVRQKKNMIAENTDDIIIIKSKKK